MNEPHNPFLALEQQLQQYTSTTTASHHFQQQLQRYSSPATTLTMFSAATPTASNVSQREFGLDPENSELHEQETPTEGLAKNDRCRNSHKRPWVPSASLAESNVAANPQEDIADTHTEGPSTVPEKRLCTENSRGFPYDHNKVQLNVEQSGLWKSLDNEVQDKALHGKLDNDMRDTPLDKMERDSPDAGRLGDSYNDHNITHTRQHETDQVLNIDEPTKGQVSHENSVKNLEENSNLDSSPATPSSGFIDIESDTPPTSPLNLSTPAIFSTNGNSIMNEGENSEGDLSENTNGHQQVTVNSHQDSALGLEVDNAKRDEPSEPHQTLQHADTGELMTEQSGGPGSPSLKASSKARSALNEERIRENVAASQDGIRQEIHQTLKLTPRSQPPEQEVSKTNFSIAAILSPGFGSSTSGCEHPKRNTGLDKPHSSSDKISADGSSNSPRHRETPSTVSSTKHSSSASIAVDLRTGTRSSSVASPSPSSRSSILSSPCSGSPSPPLTAFSVPLPIPALYNKDLLARSAFFAEKADTMPKNQDLNLNSMPDPRQLFLSELYALRQSQTDPMSRGEKPRQRLDGIGDLHTANRDKTEIYGFDKVLPGPGTRDFETFITRHLPFLSHPTLAHPAVLPFLYTSHQHFHPQRQHDHHQHKQQHPPLLSPNTVQMAAPPPLDLPRPQADSLRPLQQSHPSFPQSPSILTTSPKSQPPALRNEHIDRIHNMAKSHPDSRNVTSTVSPDKLSRSQNKNSADHKPIHFNIGKKDSTGQTHFPSHMNPLHQILNQFDPEKLFKSKEGLLSPRVSLDAAEKSRKPVQHYDKQSQNKEHRKSTLSPKGVSDHSKTQNQRDSKPSLARTLHSSATPANSDKTTGAKREQSQSKGSNSPKAEATTSPETEQKGAKGENPLWPAWVFCTRYSDRPSSGMFVMAAVISCSHIFS